MALSDLLQRIKSALGIGGTRRRRGNQPAQQQGYQQQGQQQGQPPQGQPPQGQQQGQPPQGQQQGQPAQGQPAQEQEDESVNVTVEREPATESEDAVKGTDTADETETEDEESQPEDEGESGAGTDEPVDVIKGIGATYADRLGDAGVETVADLANSDTETLSEESGISEGRLENWIEKAKHR